MQHIMEIKIGPPESLISKIIQMENWKRQLDGYFIRWLKVYHIYIMTWELFIETSNQKTFWWEDNLLNHSTKKKNNILLKSLTLLLLFVFPRAKKIHSKFKVMDSRFYISPRSNLHHSISSPSLQTYGLMELVYTYTLLTLLHS